VFLQLSDGHSCEAVAPTSGYSASHLRLLLKAFNQEGPAALRDGRASNGTALHATTDQLAALRQAVHDAPTFQGKRWSGPTVVAWFQAIYAQSIGETAARRYLVRVGLVRTPVRSASAPAPADPTRREATSLAIGNAQRPQPPDAPTRRAYPSDLTDEEWGFYKETLQRIPTTRPERTTERELLNAIFYGLRTGCAWRYLPHDFPPWQTVYKYLRAWEAAGLWEQASEDVRKKLRTQLGRDESPSRLVIDTQSVKTTEKGGSRDTMVQRK
jgi:transposase